MASVHRKSSRVGFLRVVPKGRWRESSQVRPVEAGHPMGRAPEDTLFKGVDPHSSLEF